MLYIIKVGASLRAPSKWQLWLNASALTVNRKLVTFMQIGCCLYLFCPSPLQSNKHKKSINMTLNSFLKTGFSHLHFPCSKTIPLRSSPFLSGLVKVCIRTVPYFHYRTQLSSLLICKSFFFLILECLFIVLFVLYFSIIYHMFYGPNSRLYLQRNANATKNVFLMLKVDFVCFKTFFYFLL